MNNFLKEGYNKIKDTKKYAREKNVSNWITNILCAVFTVYTSCTILTLLGILYFLPNNPNVKLPTFLPYIIPYLPFILTGLIMIKYGSYPIKGFIIFSWYLQKGMMKLINKLDMILWKKTGKDSLVSDFLNKHRRLVSIFIYGSLIVWYLVNNFPH